MFRRPALVSGMACLLISTGPCIAQTEGAERRAAEAAAFGADIEGLAVQYEVPAMVLARVRLGAPTEFVSVGVLDKAEDVPAGPDTVFQIASLSKIFTGVVAKRLVAEGVLDRDAPVTDYLPEDLPAAAKANLDGVTVRHLIHHRSGLPRDTAVHPRKGNDPMRVPLGEDDLLQDLAIAEMAFAPGERFEYSNLGYGLLGYVLERASGLSYETLIARHVTEPHGLDDTGTALPAEAEERLATPYRKEDAEVPTEPWRTGKLVAASGLYSTAADLSELLRAHLAAHAGADAGDGGLVLTEDALPTGDGRVYGYGMNVQPVMVEDEELRLHFHSGDMDGFAAFYGFVPSREEGFVLLVSRGGEGKTALQTLAIRRILNRPAD